MESKADGSESRGAYLPAMAVLAMAWLALFPITSVDSYYHVAVGEWIVEHRAIPTRAVFSATYGQQAWHDNEWGFQLLVGLLAPTIVSTDGVVEITAAGRFALVLLRALTLAATLALLSISMARAGVDPITRAIGLMLAAFLTFNNLFWAIRPQILTYLAVAALVWLVQRDRAGDRRAAAWSVVVIALWANVHGAFIVGIALLGTEAVGAWLDGESRWRRLALWTAVAPLAACVNPHGWRQVVHPFLYVVRPEIHAGNAEWTRPDWLHLPLFELTGAVFVVATLAAGRPRWADVLRVGVFVGLLATAIRHLPLAAIVLVPATASALTRAASRGGWRRNLLPTGPGWGRPPWRMVAAGMLAIAIVALSGARFVGLRPSFTERPVRAMPEDAVRKIVAGGDGLAVFNSYRFGGFLMLRLYPRDAIVMDGRNDVYGAFRDGVYNPILRAEPGWQGAWRRIVSESRVGWALLDEDAPLAAALGNETDWLPCPTSDVDAVLWVNARHDAGVRACAASPVHRADRSGPVVRSK